MTLFLMVCVSVLVVCSSVFLKLYFVGHPLPQNIGLAGIPMLLIQAIASLYIIGALASTVGASLLWAYVVSRAEISTVYPMLGLSYAIMLIPGYLLFDEAVNATKVVGILAMLIGVALLTQK